MRFTINSRCLGRKVTFSRPGSEYIFADLNGENGTLGTKLCERGRLMGYALIYGGDDPEEFASICRKWFAAFIREPRI